MKNIVSSVAALLLLVLLLFLTDPFMYWMPPLPGLIALVGAAVCVLVFAGFVLAEKANDEREAMHAHFAGRIGYLCGLGVLTVGLIVQGLLDAVDPWISSALAVMVVSRLVARWYVEKYR